MVCGVDAEQKGLEDDSGLLAWVLSEEWVTWLLVHTFLRAAIVLLRTAASMELLKERGWGWGWGWGAPFLTSVKSREVGDLALGRASASTPSANGLRTMGPMDEDYGGKD